MQSAAWLDSPPVIYKFGTTEYVDTGPTRVYGVAMSQVNQLGYSLNQYYKSDKEAPDSSWFGDGLPASYHYSGGYDEYTSGTGIAVYPSGGSVVLDQKGQDYDNVNAVYRQGNKQLVATPLPSGSGGVIGLSTTSYRYDGYLPYDWDADFYDITNGPNPDRVIGFEVNGSFGVRRYIDQDACTALGESAVAYYDAWTNDTSALGEDSYYSWTPSSYASGNGWVVTGSVRVFGTTSTDGVSAPGIPYGVGQVCLVPASSLAVATENPTIGRRKVLPSATYTGAAIAVSMPGTSNDAGTPQTPWSFTVPYKDEPWYVYSNWSVLPPFGIPNPTGISSCSAVGYVVTSVDLVQGTINSPWKWRYVYAATQTPALSGAPAHRITRFAEGY